MSLTAVSVCTSGRFSGSARVRSLGTAPKADQAERRADFHDVAQKRYADLVASGKTISWEKMRRYLEDRIAGKTVARPAAKKLAP